MKIKVCGLNNAMNAAIISALPVDYCGMIFFESSPRFVTRETEVKVAQAIHPSRSKVAVFVNALKNDILRTAITLGINVIQLHGDERPELCLELKKAGYAVIKTFHIKEPEDFLGIEKYEDSCSLFLFDTFSKSYGGTGEKFNWNLLDRYKGTSPFLLSGGIGPGDALAISRIRHPKFYGVDINSRFEISPGVKNVQLLKDFIDEIRSY